MLYHSSIIHANKRFFEQLRNLQMCESRIRQKQRDGFLMTLIRFGHSAQTHQDMTLA